MPEEAERELQILELELGMVVSHLAGCLQPNANLLQHLFSCSFSVLFCFFNFILFFGWEVLTAGLYV